MGCDIHAYVEERSEDGSWKLVDDNWMDCRSYGIFGFLADVRNYSHVNPISPPKGVPSDVSDAVRAEYDAVRAEYDAWDCDAHTPSWLTLEELMAPDYDSTFWDRRVTKQVGPNHWDGAALAEEGEGRTVSLREFLGEYFFREVERLKDFGKSSDIRVVFWFDN